MLSRLSLTERPKNCAASRGILSKWWDLVISQPFREQVNVNSREPVHTGRDRLPVKETCEPCVHRNDARRAVLLVTGRDRDNSWCAREPGWTASTAGSGNRAARHFCAIHGYGEDATLKGFTNWEITGGELRHNFLRFRLIFIHFFGVCKFLNGESRLPI